MHEPVRPHFFKAALAAPALLSALLFGATTPLAKQLLIGTDPLLVAGLLYAGSGTGLSLWLAIRSLGHWPVGLSQGDWPWLTLAILAGGIAAPALLMYGLLATDAATASLLLNLEMVGTAAIAWLVFREATSPRVVFGFGLILAGSLALVWPARLAAPGDLRALAAIVSACLLWAVDNNLTRKISGGDAWAIAALKGLAAGGTNIALALMMGASFPAVGRIIASLGVGFLGYGVSLVLFVQSLRQLGTARTGAYFSAAPFIGGGLAVLLYGQAVGGTFWVATALMLAGVWLHLTERHAHEHTHEVLMHSHAHVHDEHHGHDHAPDWDGLEPHAHEHRHEPLRHSHAHFPDLHHRHRH